MNRLLTDRRVTSLHLGRESDGLFAIEVCRNGRIFKRIGFDTSGQAWRWATEQAYGAEK